MDASVIAASNINPFMILIIHCLQAIQIALVHLMFNLIGIILFYPIPVLRWPISLARTLGDNTAQYRYTRARTLGDNTVQYRYTRDRTLGDNTAQYRYTRARTP